MELHSQGYQGPERASEVVIFEFPRKSHLIDVDLPGIPKGTPEPHKEWRLPTKRQWRIGLYSLSGMYRSSDTMYEVWVDRSSRWPRPGGGESQRRGECNTMHGDGNIIVQPMEVRQKGIIDLEELYTYIDSRTTAGRATAGSYQCSSPAWIITAQGMGKIRGRGCSFEVVCFKLRAKNGQTCMNFENQKGWSSRGGKQWQESVCLVKCYYSLYYDK